MKRLLKEGLDVLEFEELGFSGCYHGFFTRHGGVSPTPWNSLNMGGGLGDEKANVIENRRRAFYSCHRNVDSIFDVWQVHGNNVVCTDKPRDLNEPHVKADAIFTNNPKITLLMRFADCVPIMIFDPVKRVVGIIHAGWRGTVNNIVKSAIHEIVTTYEVNPEDIQAGIGPSIGPDHYVIGEEVRKKVELAFGKSCQDSLYARDGKIHFDLRQANKYLLQQQGVKSIESSRICTACHIDDWYSHRAENGATGRFGAIIALKE